MKALLSRQFILFLAVGVLNTAFSYSVFVACVWLGMSFAIATLIATVLGILFNFRTTGAIVFSSHDRRRFALFLGMYAAVYVLNISLQKVFQLAGMSIYLSGFVALPPCVLAAFLLSKYIVFPTRRRPESPACHPPTPQA